MPVDSLHPEHEAALPDWRLMRDVIEGERTVKAAGTAYVPRLKGQTEDEFQAMVQRGVFFNATSRAADGHHGMIFRKDPTVTAGGELAAFLRDATMEGHTWYDYAKDTVRDIIQLGRRGTLVDWNMGPENRPYVVAYEPEEIINWATTRIQGQVMLSLLTLKEWSSRHIPEIDGPSDTDEFTRVHWPQWRVYRLVEDADGQPYVTCTVYRLRKPKEADKKLARGKRAAALRTAHTTGRGMVYAPGTGPANKHGEEFVVIDTATPTRRGVPLDRIPFVFHGPLNSLPGVPKIPLLDMARLNLSHFRTSVDLENGRHITALPTPYVTGYAPPEGQELRLGSSVAWTIEEKDASVDFLEFSGAGLQALKEALAEKEGQMAGLGARMLEPESKKAEAYDTVAMRSTGETSALTQIAISAGESLSQVLRWVAWWMGTAKRPEDLVEQVTVELNTDFLTNKMDPAMLQAISAAYLGGALDPESYLDALKKGELVKEDVTVEDFLSSIQENVPGIPMPDPAPPGGK